MAYNEFLADRITQFFREKSIPFEARKMMGGLCFMVDGKMCVGVNKDQVMARIDPEVYEISLLKPGCIEMNFTGRPMKGFVFLTDEATDLDDDLYDWLQLALDFNPKAKASKKKKKK
ncbi:TfoX/Sxy family protein [Pseudotenacibaculum sp. MALMAid0570]|uniref:TfoX/Sxy family protein n=1 Tax=Pseudotenacibaculum sp. MALMAid0570 TaxID=3143938 RepID=UPI0032DFC198